MKIVIGADHRGFELKELLKGWLVEKGYEVEDVGAERKDMEDDYVDYAEKVGAKVVEGMRFRVQSKLTKLDSEEDGRPHPNPPLKGEGIRGILICGSGVGMSVSANKMMGIRCAVGLSPSHVEAARRDDDITVLSIAADYMTELESKEMVEKFLSTDFSGAERHVRRLEKMEDLEMEQRVGCGGGGCGCGH